MNQFPFQTVVTTLQLVFMIGSAMVLGAQLFIWDQARRDGHALALSGRDGALKLIAIWNRSQELIFLAVALLFVSISVIRSLTDTTDEGNWWELIRLLGLVVIVLLFMVRTAMAMRVRAQLSQYAEALKPTAPPAPIVPSQALTSVAASTPEVGDKKPSEEQAAVIAHIEEGDIDPPPHDD